MAATRLDQAKDAAAAVGEFFSGNPFATHVGQKIEQATEGTLASENWGLNMEICDMINMTDEGPRDAMRAIKKRLQTQMGKNNTCVLYCLTVLETCVKNCDRRFHNMICQKEFINELVKMIGPKYDPPQVVQEKVLSLIQTWADAFRNQPDLKAVSEVYDDLKSKGVEFPMTDLDSLAPIHTPQRSVVTSQHPPASSGYRNPPDVVDGGGVGGEVGGGGVGEVVGVGVGVSGPVTPTPEQLSKLRSELDIVNGNMRVLREMLSELHPGKEDAEDLSLLRDLYSTCRQMQQRIVHLLENVANEEVTSELLLVNDELNNVFIKYERFMKNRSQPQTQANKDGGAGDSSQPLIDLGDSPPVDLSTQLANMSVDGNQLGNIPSVPASTGAREEQEEFDMFAATRSTTYEQSRQGGSTYADNTVGLDQVNVTLGTVAQQRVLEGAEVKDKEQDLKEMEAWLKDTQPQPDSSRAQAPDGTTAEFDQFLAGRAETGQGLPAAGRQVKDKNEEEQKMFAL